MAQSTAPRGDLPRPVLDPPIGAHGVIGDRRTAALVCADGTIDWLCLPWYNSSPTFGSIVHGEPGGFWRIGPDVAGEGRLGKQTFDGDAPVLRTVWNGPDWGLEVVDSMSLPQTHRDHDCENARTVVRRIRCLHGTAPVSLEMRPVCDWTTDAVALPGNDDVACWRVGEEVVQLWTSFPLDLDDTGATARVALHEGEVAWAMLACGAPHTCFGVDAATAQFTATLDYWRAWMRGVDVTGSRAVRVRRSAMLIHLLTCAPAGATVAAPTTSLPGRIGSSQTWDYRYPWVRDASLSAGVLARLGKVDDVTSYLDWMCEVAARAPDAPTDAPLGILHQFDGTRHVPEQLRSELRGWRNSRPVRTGNLAWKQVQHDVTGFFVDCAHTYLAAGGIWADHLTWVVVQATNHAAAHWQDPDNGIWELRGGRQRWLSGIIMSWVALDRALRIAERLGWQDVPLDAWARSAARARETVLTAGWNDDAQHFRQRLGDDRGIDAASLLAPLHGLLDVHDPRVTGDVRAIRERLMIDNLVHRYDPAAVPGAGEHDDPTEVGVHEASFLPCTGWLALVHAQRGEIAQAQAILDRVDAASGELGWLPEQIDAHNGELLGNSPLLFSHVEYVRAALALHHAEHDLASEDNAQTSLIADAGMPATRAAHQRS